MSAGIPPLPPRTERLGSHRRPRSLLKTVLYVFLSLLIGGAVYAGYLFYKFDSLLDHVSSGKSGNTAAKQSASVKPMAFLLLGLDTRQQTGSLNTDVIMVATLNPIKQTAAIISIPRDTYFKPEGYRARKINSFYSVALREDKDKADDLLKSMIGDYLGIPIDYMAVVNFKTFEDIVDKFGGIRVDVDMDMRYVDHADGTDINLHQGSQVLNGKQALDFVRYRKSNMGTAGSSDFQRNERQQKVVSAIVDKFKTLEGALKLGGVLDGLRENVKTDIPKTEMEQFIKTYFGINNERIQYYHLEGSWQSPYTYLDTASLEKAKSMLREQLNP